MPNFEIETDFPDLAESGYNISSDLDDSYNCIGYACGYKDQWIDPCEDAGYDWPEGIPRDGTIDSLTKLFERNGYSTCGNGELEQGFEKVALYGSSRIYEHAARQLPN